MAQSVPRLGLQRLGRKGSPIRIQAAGPQRYTHRPQVRTEPLRLRQRGLTTLVDDRRTPPQTACSNTVRLRRTFTLRSMFELRRLAARQNSKCRWQSPVLARTGRQNPFALRTGAEAGQTVTFQHRTASGPSGPAERSQTDLDEKHRLARPPSNRKQQQPGSIRTGAKTGEAPDHIT